MRALRQFERVAEQHRRAAVREYKIQEKQQAIADAARAVRQFEEYTHTLVSIHTTALTPVDWPQLLATPEPSTPIRASKNEEVAVCKQTAYSPSLFARLLHLEGIKRRALEKKVTDARERDEIIYRKQKAKYEEELTEWVETQEMAKGVLAKDPEAYKQVLDYFGPFAELAEFGTRITLNLRPESAQIEIFAASIDVVPENILSQTTTGKLSKKSMPAGRRHALYQDFVCSCALRIGRDVLACLPLPLVVVNVSSKLLDTSTGISAESPILSVAITPGKLRDLDFNHLDPSDSMTNFPFRMKFGKTTGFSPVERLDPAGLLFT